MISLSCARISRRCPHRRLSAVDGPFRHYNGAARVQDDPKGGSRFIWTADVLPDEIAQQVEQMMNVGIAVVKRTLESDVRAA